MDPISDMLTGIRNALTAKKEVVGLPSSRVKREIARILKEEGFVSNYKVFEDGKAGTLKILLRYTKDKEPAISGISRVSKPSCRIYRSYKNLSGTTARGAYSTVVLSTSKGILTARQAKSLKLGGEVLLEVW
ncbi:MAG: 30S ribosomal protein S8 [Elusimicrobia bacterium]|nr:30S ribosomal protein S8 [Elusimicrobiota bacterium]